ncbi:MAG TPA: DUF2442 domain-containing protein [Leptolyngbya sp.]|jgi:hypothetical protein|nr:DUF2442 domain-containing protein [Leptolyngbya sp.]
MLYRILTLVPLENYQIGLIYSDGFETVVDFNATIEQGGIFTTLRNPKLFSQAKLSENGRYIHWGEIDFCADALRLEPIFQKLKPSTAKAQLQ